MVPDIKKILFTTDLTKSAGHAYNYAVSIASRYGASVTVLYVMAEPSRSYSDKLKDFLGEERWQQVQESHEQHARQVLIGKKHEAVMVRKALGEFSEKAKVDYQGPTPANVEVVVTSGNVVDEILSESQSRACDLIVMGHHIRGKFEEAILGSVTRRVLRKSKVPVLLVQLPEKEEEKA